MNDDKWCGWPVTWTKSSDVEQEKSALDSDRRRTVSKLYDVQIHHVNYM